MEELINEYKTLDKANFNNFNFYILEDLDQDYRQKMEDGNNFLREIAFSIRNSRFLENLSRKSNFT